MGLGKERVGTDKRGGEIMKKKGIPFKICLGIGFVAGWMLGEFILKVFQIP